MKKSLLLLACAAMASAVSAQTVIGLATSEDFEAAGLSGTKTEIAGGTVIVDNEAGTFGLAYTDSWGTTSTYKNYRTVQVGDSEPIVLGSGAVGNTNPTFTSYQAGVMDSGAVFKIHANKDGWMTLFTKINPNKQYVVFEGKTGALPYTLGVAGADYQIFYTLPVQTSGFDEGYIDFNAPDASKYFIGATKQSKNEAGQPLWYNEAGDIVAGERPVWTNADGKEVKGGMVMEDIPGQNKPQFPYLVAGMEKAPGESTGFVTFNVLADNDYYFSALGSKAACGGFVFTEAVEEPTVKFHAELDEEGNVKFPEVVFGESSAVETIGAAVEDENAPVYNMLGIRVNADAKGLLIKNGKKFIRK